MAGRDATVTRIRLQAATPDPVALTLNTATVPLIIVGQRLSVMRDAIRGGGAHSVVGCIDLAVIVAVRLPGVYFGRSDLKEKPAQEMHSPSASTVTDPFADRSSLVCRKLMDANAPDMGWHTTAAAPVGDVDRFGDKLKRLFPTRLDFALTLTAGAARVAPHAPVDTIHCYVSTSPDERRAQRSPLAMLKAIAAECSWPVSGDGRLVLHRQTRRRHHSGQRLRVAQAIETDAARGPVAGASP